MNRYIQRAAWMAVLLLAAAGCSSSSSSDDSGGSDMDDLARMLDEAKAAESEKPAATTAPAAWPAKPPKTDVAAPQAKPPAQTAKPRAAEVVQEPGKPQVIGQRRYRNTVEGPLRYYGALASARMVIKDRILWAQLKSTADAYQAEHGRYPGSTEEYMDVIINKNGLELPELPPGQEYYFDPSDHELKIVEVIEQPSDGNSPPVQ